MPLTDAPEIAAVWWQSLVRPDVVWVLVPVVAIIIGGVIAVVQMVIAHRERMAMIEQGMHPDEQKQSEPEERPASVR